MADHASTAGQRYHGSHPDRSTEMNGVSPPSPTNEMQIDITVGETSNFQMADGGKSRAEEFRYAYRVREKEKGNKLARIESDYFRDASGHRFGVTWSEEHDGKWFLNLMDGKFDHAVLLCQTKPEESIVVKLPNQFLSRYWNLLSKDSNGEVKFRIVRNRGLYFIQLLQPAGLREITQFLDGFVRAPLFEFA